MADTLDRDQRRINRKLILDALNEETGSNGGDAAAPRVIAYRADPVGSSTTEFGYVGGLAIRRWYVAADQPDDGQRASLWQNIMGKMGKSAADPGGWDGSTLVMRLQVLAEGA